MKIFEGTISKYESYDLKTDVFFNIVYSAISRATESTTIISAVVSLWSAGKGLYIITDGITRIYRLPYKRFWLFKRIFAMGYTVIMLLLIVIAFVALFLGILFAKEINSLLNYYFPGWLGRIIVYLAVDVLMGLAMVTALKMYLWRKIPDNRFSKIRVLLPGIVITVVGWNIVMFGSSIYAKYFASSSIYGSLATIPVFFMMIYFMMYILLCGMQFNYIYRRQIYMITFRRKLKRTGEPLPEIGTEIAESDIGKGDK